MHGQGTAPTVAGHLTRMRLLLLLLLTTTSALRADALADLQAKVYQLAGTDPVAGTIELAFADVSGDEKQPTRTEGRAHARIALGAEGLQIGWSPEQLATALREQAESAGKPKQPAPTHQAMARLNATAVLDYLNAAQELLRELEVAHLVSVQDDRWHEQPARLLTLKLDPPLSDEDRKVIKKIEATARVWVGQDGVPLAAESTLSLKGRVMLVISFEHSQKETFQFTRVGQRLLVAGHTKETADNGGGQHARSTTQATLQLAPL